MQNTLTPGPWSVQRTSFPCNVHVVTPDRIIANVTAETPDEALAISRAIAAVPELVAALRAVIAALTQPVQTTPHSGEDSVSSLLGCIDVLRRDARFAVNEARATLSKAGQA